jgi:hypothetical protein
MTAQPTACELVRRLQSSWPDWLPPLLPSEDPSPVESHPLAGEIEALLQGNSASLPFFPEGSAEIAWITLAHEGESLRAAYRELRAWLLPSVGWEDPRGAFVSQGAIGNPLLETLSPSGYLRWRSRREPAAVQSIVTRLRTARELAEARPERLVERVPSLLELRQRFAVSLVAGDRPAAEHVIETIDRHRLDTASNTGFLRVRLWDHFADPARIVEMPELEHLLHIRLPHRVRLAICRAFHAARLAGPEQDADLDEICRVYSDAVDPLVGPLVERCGPKDGTELRRMRGYRAWKTHNAEVARDILAEAEDAVLQTLLGPLVESSSFQGTQDSLEERFFEARKQQDWLAVQELGELLVSGNPEVVPILRKSLQLRPNPDLQSHLDQLAPHPLPAVADVPPVAATTSLPQTWAEWLLHIPEGDPGALELFLEGHEQLSWGTLKSEEVQALVDAFTEVLTSPSGAWPPTSERIYNIGLAELIGECLEDPAFPRQALLEPYRLLAQAWDRSRRGSVFPPDGQVLLELAEALLQASPVEEPLASELIEAWWRARPVKALLPFLLAAVELFDRLGTSDQAERFWMLAGSLHQRQRDTLTAGERRLWRLVGKRLGYGDDLLDEFLPMPAGSDPAQGDLLRAAGLNKIAIVSTREEQARAAVELLSERTDAELLVITATTSGHETRAALDADLIAYVWAASAHAVFRAFDKIDRKKIVYVQGTGAVSIVLAVERWVAEHFDAEASPQRDE